MFKALMEHNIFNGWRCMKECKHDALHFKSEKKNIKFSLNQYFVVTVCNTKEKRKCNRNFYKRFLRLIHTDYIARTIKMLIKNHIDQYLR